MESERKLIWEDLYVDLEGPLNTVINNLLKARETYSNYADLRIESTWDRHGDQNRLELQGGRPETDEEYNKRIKEEEESEARQKVYRKRQFEALKKEFGNVKK